MYILEFECVVFGKLRKLCKTVDDIPFIFALDLDRGILDLNLRNCLIDKQNYHDELSRKQREKERDFRTLKKTELLLKVSLDALTQTQALNQRLLLEVGVKNTIPVFKLRALLQKALGFCYQ